MRARAFQGHRRVLRVRAHDRHGAGLGIQAHRHLEEPLRPADRRIGSGRHDLEVAVVLELGVDVQPEQRHESEIALHHDRHRRRDDVGAVARHDEVHLVDVEQLRVDPRHGRGARLVVVVDELDLAAEDPAFGVDVVAPDFHRDQRRLAVAGERPGQAHAEADLERLLRERRTAQTERDQQGAQRAPENGWKTSALAWHGPSPRWGC